MRFLLSLTVSSLLVNLLFADFEFDTSVIAPIDKCIDLDDTSLIYRCSNDSIWSFYYEDSNVCNGVATTINHYGGCSDGNINLVKRCATAKSISAANSGNCKYYADASNKVAYPLDVCYNTGSSSSRRYSCNNSLPYRYTYSDADCSGTPIITLQTSAYYDCDGVDCHASVYIYEFDTDSGTCNFEDSNYQPGDVNDCNYIIVDQETTSAPYAIDVCFSNREGYYEYSSKYVCNGTDVQLYRWLDDSECSKDSTKYLISTYSSLNYTIQCNADSCKNGKIRTYDDCDHKAYYTETPIAWDQCIQSYHAPELDNNNTFDQYQYYMYTCIDGYASIFYFLDSECSTMDAFYVYNTSESSCPSVVSGCSNNNDVFSNSGNMINYYNGYIISIIILLIKQLF